LSRMAVWIKPSRVRRAIVALAEWRESGKSQSAMHLWPLLAILEAGANKATPVHFEEANEFDFWSHYCILPGEKRERKDAPDHFTQDYYVDPLVRMMRAADHPHRGPWTIRVRTFLNSWHAIEAGEGNKDWRLSADYATIFSNKALMRDGLPHRVPVVDLAVWLFRSEEFRDDADAAELEGRFRSRFKQDPADYELLFEYRHENAKEIFVAERPRDSEYRKAIEDALLMTPDTTSTPKRCPVSLPLLDDDDPIYMQVKELLSLGSSGIILEGAPGTGKTWYAKQIARKLVVDASAHTFEVQFHPSFGYEDFIEGFSPNEESKSGFRMVPKVFLRACDAARGVDTPVVFIIDEINRGDPARILGELLTGCTSRL